MEALADPVDSERPWLLPRLPGTGGARPPGGLGAPPIIPGTGGAPPMGGPPPPPPDELAMMGAERSFVTAFFSALPLVMSESSAPCRQRNPC